MDGAGVSLKERDRPVWTWSSSDGAFALPELDAGPKRVLVPALGLQATAFDIELGPEGADSVVLKLEREIVPPEVPEGLALDGTCSGPPGPLALEGEGRAQARGSWAKPCIQRPRSACSRRPLPDGGGGPNWLGFCQRPKR